MIFKCSYCKKDFTNIKDCEDCEADCKKLFDEQEAKENQRKEDWANVEKARNEYSKILTAYSNKYKTAILFHSSDAVKKANEFLNEVFKFL